MTVTLIGLGCGTEATLTGAGREALLAADFIAGASRLLQQLPAGCTDHRAAATKPADLLRLIEESGAAAPCVVYSGDTGFYSGTRSLLPYLKNAGMEADILPGISSVQYFAARLGESWQNWTLVSAHGVVCDPVRAVCGGRPAFFLTGGTLGPGNLCALLAEAGLGNLPVTVGENLSYPEEKLFTGTAAEFAGREFEPLSVMLAGAAPRAARRVPGLPDDVFLRGDVPMTKQEVRAAALAKLGIGPEDTCWDVGAGTGSVSVELALQAKEVWAVEHKPAALDLTRANREAFGAWNLHVVAGKAPDALAGLPAPDAVFVGGTGGKMKEVIAAALAANPAARICCSAIALESLSAAVDAFAAFDLEAEVCQIAVSRTRAAGKLHLLMAQNPVFLITGAGR